MMIFNDTSHLMQSMNMVLEFNLLLASFLAKLIHIYRLFR